MSAAPASAGPRRRRARGPGVGERVRIWEEGLRMGELGVARLVLVQSSLGGALLLTSDEMKNRGKKNGRWKGMTCGVRMPVSGEREWSIVRTF